jgi:hypothetical protein
MVCRKGDAGIQASERDPLELEPSFNSPTSKISPQSRHSTYWVSSSLAMSWVRLCWQAGSGIKRSTKKLDGLYILADLNWRAWLRPKHPWRLRLGKAFFQEELAVGRQAMLGLTNVRNDTISLVTNYGEM